MLKNKNQMQFQTSLKMEKIISDGTPKVDNNEANNNSNQLGKDANDS